MSKFYIKHITKYTYSNNVIDGATLLRLHPIIDDYQKVTSHLISVTNNPYIDTFIDFFNNRVGTFMVTEPHHELNIVSDIEVTTSERIFPDDSVDTGQQWKELKRIQNTIQFIDYTKYQPFSGNQEIKDIILDKMLKTKSPFKAVLELCEYVYNEFEYKAGISHVKTPLKDTWKKKAGVCQDFTNVLLKMTRILGVPARYVSGYICPDENISRGTGATHAWIEAYIPFYGWIGIDPTNNTIANQNHIRLAVGRYYKDCSPVKGVYKGNVEEKMEVSVEIKTSKITEPIPTELTTPPNSNSYKRNLEIKNQNQQQQGQQQQQ